VRISLGVWIINRQNIIVIMIPQNIQKMILLKKLTAKTTMIYLAMEFTHPLAVVVHHPDIHLVHTTKKHMNQHLILK
jgi:hypothetical protein